MNAFHIALKDLRIFFKDRGAVLLLILLPLLFVVVFSGALTAIGSAEPDTRVPLPLVDLDGGESALALRQDLDEAGGVRIELYDELGRAEARLDKREISRMLIIPAGFTDDLADNRQVTLRLVSHPDASSEETEAVRLVIEGVARDLSLQSQIEASLRRMSETMMNAPEDYQVLTPERMIEQARSQFEDAQERQLVEVTQRVPGQPEEEKVNLEDLTRTTSAGFAVLFVFLTGQATARSIYDEKKAGSFRRLLAAPMSKAAMLTGKMLSNILLGVVQVAVIFAFGTIGMRLLGLTPMALENAPLAVILVALLVTLCSSSFGILIAALARTENQIGGLSQLLLWIMGAIGGCFIPLVFLEGFLGPLPKIAPHYWANHAFDNLLLRGLGLGDVLVDMLVLLGFTAAFFVIGLWRFDFD